MTDDHNGVGVHDAAEKSPALMQRLTPVWRRDRLALVAGLVLLGVLAAAIFGWWRDPHLERSLVMLVTFQVLATSCVLALFYTWVRSLGRRLMDYTPIAMRDAMRAEAGAASSSEVEQLRAQVASLTDLVRSGDAARAAQDERLEKVLCLLAGVEGRMDELSKQVGAVLVEAWHVGHPEPGETRPNTNVTQLRPRS